MRNFADDLMIYANSFRFGYVKAWKANGIASTLEQDPDIVADTDRLIRYVENCLLMEGFSRADCEMIAIWIFLNFKG